MTDRYDLDKDDLPTAIEPFELRPYQNDIYKMVKEAKIPPVAWLPYRYKIGVDPAAEDGDKSMVIHSEQYSDGVTQIWFDEASEWPSYKWYRNSIKWWQWRKMMKRLAKDVDELKKQM